MVSLARTDKHTPPCVPQAPLAAPQKRKGKERTKKKNVTTLKSNQPTPKTKTSAAKACTPTGGRQVPHTGFAVVNQRVRAPRPTSKTKKKKS